MNVSEEYRKAVENLHTVKSGDVNFVIIGAMDGVRHDPLSYLISQHPTWSGLLIEPVHDMFEKLCAHYEGRENLKFENCAIGENAGTAMITRVPVETIGDEWPAWLDGCSTLCPEQHLISNYASITVQEEIEIAPLHSVLVKHGVTRIDIFQSDTEGYDKIVFDQLWKSGLRPSIIYLEIKDMSISDLFIIETILSINGYTYIKDGEDLMAAR